MNHVRDLASVDGRPILDANHIGPIVLIFIPTFLCPAGFLVISTIIVRKREGAVFSWSWTNPVMWDFTGLTFRLVVSTAWSAVVCAQLQVGLGTAHPPENVALFEKYEYTSELLYVTAIMLWKFTTGMSNAQIFGLADNKKRLSSTVLTVLITIGFMGVLLATAFQCDGPDYWAIRGKAGRQCFSRPAFWAAVGGLDILSDVVIQGLLAVTILRSQVVSTQKRSALTIVTLYLIAYIATTSVRLAFVVRSWASPIYPLLAARTALSTFSQLVFPMCVLCIGKLSRFLDLESYLSPAIGASSRRLPPDSIKNHYLAHYYGQNSANATGPGGSQRGHKKTYGDSVEELPLTTNSKSEGHNGEQHSEGDVELNDVIMVKRDVVVRSESGSL